MTTTADVDLAAEICGMPTEKLEGLSGASPPLGELAKAELAKRAARERRRANPVDLEWYELAYAQYRDAERECNGHLVNDAAFDRAKDQAKQRADQAGMPVDMFFNVDVWPWPKLWKGPQWEAEHYASWELLRYWEAHGGRYTITAHRERMAREKEAEHREYLDRDASDSLRSVARGDAGEGAEDRSGDQHRGRHAVPRSDAGGRPSEAVGSSTRADGWRGAFVRSAVTEPVRLTREEPVAVIPGDPAARVAQLAAHVRGGGDILRRPESLSGPLSMPAQPSTPAAPRSPATVAVRERGAVASGKREIDGDEVLRYMRTFLAHFAVWPSDAALTAGVLWAAQAHGRDKGTLMPVWPYCSRFLVTSADYNSGKSKMASLIIKLAPNGERLLSPTAPSFYDLLADHKTAMISEADEQFRSPGASRKILAAINAGYEPDCYHTRKRGDKVIRIPVTAPVLLDGLDSLLSATRPDLKTMISRCIVIRVQKAPDDYRAPRFDRAARGAAALISARCAQWMADQVEAGIGDDIPELPEGLGKRAADLWEPLFAVAARAGGNWPELCEEACEQLTAADGLPDENEDALSDLDRMMAEWD